MKKRVILRRIFHRDYWRIGIFFGFDEKLKDLVKSLPGSVFSATNKCFYLDDSEDNLRLILKTLKDIVEVDISALISDMDEKETIRTFTARVTDDPEAEMHMEREEGKGKGKDSISVSVSSGDATRAGGYPGKGHQSGGKNVFGPVEFRISEKEGSLVIKFLGRYDPAWVEELRTYGKCYYDKKRKEWFLPWKKITCDSLADYFASNGVAVDIRKLVVSEELKAERKNKGDEIRAKQLGRKALDGLDAMELYLDENRYSTRTRESYLSAIEFFFRYFSPKDPMEITEDEISLFLYNHIVKLGYSASYQNQMVSAVKVFYMIGGKGKVNPALLGRPRRGRALPKVFSKEEVSSILNATRNIKHKALLWLVYSCGLRRSEVTNIKLTDLDRNRGIIQIREAKGMIDRIVPVSVKVWEKLDEYIRAYTPRVYVFEGQTGGRYSVESVYHVFKDALMRAGINKEVGIHSLRHSYATHLHENGLDIRYIQELLGHKSTKTTEIYTHVSRRNLVQVRSPIDDLDVS